MHHFLTVGDEVTFQGLLDIRLFVEEVNELNGSVKCKYFDEHLKRFIKLSLPGDSLVVCRKKVRADKSLER